MRRGECVTPNLRCVDATFGPLVAFADDTITQQIIDFGAHTRVELALLLSVVHPGDRVFDLGAHIGSFTIPLAQKVGPAGRVAAVEAIAETFDVLAANVALNGLSERVCLRRALVAPHARYEKVTVPGNSGATHFVPASEGAPVEVLSVDALAAQMFVPDVVKIDLEGFDAWALTSSALIADRRPILYVEIVPEHLARAGSNVGELDELLRRLGYRLFRNIGDRNAAHDRFELIELAGLREGGEFFDLLAIRSGDPRMPAAAPPADGRSA
jgi:FkbM family methyltransferase